MKCWLLALAACSSASEPTSPAGGFTPTITRPDAAVPDAGAPVAAITKPKAIAYDLCHGAWCWVSGRPQGNTLNDVITRGKEAWAVGAWGTVLHHDGTRWTAESIGEARLDAVWVAETGEVWVIGDDVIARRAGLAGRSSRASSSRSASCAGSREAPPTTWRARVGRQDVATMPGAPTGIRLHRLDARTASDIWMTSASTVWHYDGKGWTSEKVDRAWWSLLVEPDAVWIGAEDGALLRRSR